MSAVLELLAEHPVLLLFLVVGLGAAVGHVTVKGIGLGAAAVLFLALVFGGLGSARDVELVVPPAFGTLGLTLFTFTVGVVSGAEFFASLRKSKPKSLTITVKPNTTVLIAARFNEDRTSELNKGGYWDPVAWKEIAETCP